MDVTFTNKPNGDRVRDRLAIFAHSTEYGRGLNVLICTVDYQDRIVAACSPLVFKGEVEPHAYIPPTLSGPPATEFLQAALDAAWKVGLRPTNWHDERPGEIKAKDAHLQDMRRLVFGGPQPVPDFLELQKGQANVG